jgi:hypothetical protein
MPMIQLTAPAGARLDVQAGHRRRIETSPEGGLGTCTLRLTHEGPPCYGACAVLLDELYRSMTTTADPGTLWAGAGAVFFEPAPEQTQAPFHGLLEQR